MSAVIRQDPWGVMPRLQDEINRLFGNARENDSSSATAMWIPLPIFMSTPIDLSCMWIYRESIPPKSI